jgi:AcrR family transcriptional regulator
MTHQAAAERPRRDSPAGTRARLLATAAEVFNRDGYLHTNSNKLARAAGYSPGAFYKHFENKRGCFLAVYRAWVTAQWTELEAILERGGAPEPMAKKLVNAVLALHARWSGLRASLRTLVATDPAARAFHRDERRRQLELIAGLRRRLEVGKRAPEEDALLLYALERVADALADGEIADLKLDHDAVVSELVALVARHLSGSRPSRARR